MATAWPAGFSALASVVDATKILGDDGSANGYLTASQLKTYLNISVAAEADIVGTGTIAWDATPPSSLSAARYSWCRVGSLVQVQMRLEYGSAGTSNTSLTVTWPSDLPAPRIPTGTANGEAFGMCAGSVFTTNMSANPTLTRAVLRKQASTYEAVLLPNAAANLVGAVIFFSYITDA